MSNPGVLTTSTSLGTSRASLYMDASRAILAGVVAFGHAWVLLIEDYRATDNVIVNFAYFAAGFGHAAVILFFVLSGFWIGRSVISLAGSGWSWRLYLRSRLTRLMIVLVPALVLGGTFDLIGLALASPTHLALTGAYVLPASVAKTLTLTDFFGNLVFLQRLVVPPFGSNGPLWSLAYEFWFYLWFPALWLAVRYRHFSIVLATFVLAIFNPDLLLHFPPWLAGVFVFLAVEWLERRPAALPALRRHLWLLASLIFIAAMLWARTGNYRGEDMLFACAFAALLLGWLLNDPPRFPGLNVLARFGRNASFSLYVTHFPMMALAAAVMIGRERMPPDAIGATAVLSSLLIAVLLALGFARLTEANTERLRDWITDAVQRRRGHAVSSRCIDADR